MWYDKSPQTTNTSPLLEEKNPHSLFSPFTLLCDSQHCTFTCKIQPLMVKIQEYLNCLSKPLFPSLLLYFQLLTSRSQEAMEGLSLWSASLRLNSFGIRVSAPPSHVLSSISLLQVIWGLDFYKVKYLKKIHSINKQPNEKYPLSSICFKYFKWIFLTSINPAYILCSFLWPAECKRSKWIQ